MGTGRLKNLAFINRAVGFNNPATRRENPTLDLKGWRSAGSRSEWEEGWQREKCEKIKIGINKNNNIKVRIGNNNNNSFTLGRQLLPLSLFIALYI